jgi:hypothetical protein
MEIDVIDESLPFDGENLLFSSQPKRLLRFDSGKPLDQAEDGSFLLKGKGRLLLIAPGYFSES